MKWFDIAGRPEKLKTFNFFIGGRGIGKTYSLIRYVLEKEVKFLYLRNTAKQIEISASDAGNPFKRYNADHGLNIYLDAEKNFCNIVRETDEDREVIGYAASASTFSNLRGVDLSDVKIIFFDEFIEEKSNQLKFNQFDAFAHLYETINRNRELLGEDAVQCFFLSNAQTLNSPILAGFNVVNEIERMRYAGQDTLTRGNIYVSLCKNEVSEAKTKTAIYQATKGSKFYDESIRNEFSHDSFSGIGKRNLREYIPVFGFDEWYCYKHKSKPEFYICTAYSNRVPEFRSINGFSLWARSYWQTMTDAISRGAVYYESYTLKMEFERLMRWR